MDNIQEKKIYLGIDYGTKRIGLALANSTEKIARSFKIIHKFKELNDIIPSKGITDIVIGWPLQPDGTEGTTCENVKLFSNQLKNIFNLPIYFFDERLTSKHAEIFLKESLFMRPEKRKEILDAESARIILQKFLEQKK